MSKKFIYLAGGCLCLFAAAASGTALAAKKLTAADWQNDPRSGALLNVLAAKEAVKAGYKPQQVITPRPRYIQFNATVNDPAADTTAQDTQSETTVVDLGGGNLVAGFNDSGSHVPISNNHFTGFAWSNNNGVSWTDGGKLPDSAGGDAGDPVLAYHQGTASVYLVTLGFTTGNSLQVFKSTDNGHTFGAPASGTPGFVTTDFQDKPWMTVDNFAGAGNSNIYLCWTRFPSAGSATIFVTRSTDSGATFGPSGGTLISNGGQGCFVTVSPNHQVNVYYYRGTGAGGQGGDNKLFMRASTDQGVTFQPEVQIADLTTTTTNGNLGLSGGLRSNSFPHAAVNPVAARPTQIVIYNDKDPANPAQLSEIYYVRSLDNGATWSAPVKVNDDLSGDQFFPTIGVTPDRFMLGYYSRSQDANNLLFHRRSRIGTIAATGDVGVIRQSFQLGPNTPIVIGQDPVINTVYMGDYDVISGLAVGGSSFFSSTWADHRSGNAFHKYQPDVRFARIALPITVSDMGVAVSSAAASLQLGQSTNVTVTVTAGAQAANDVFVNIPLATGLAFLSINSVGGSCTQAAGFVGCHLGTIAAGASKTIQLNTMAVMATGARTVSASATTSSADLNLANNSASAGISVVAGSTVQTVYSTGNIATALPDNSTVDIPVTVPDLGNVVGIGIQLRMNHTFDADVVATLISPTGQKVSLINRRGGSGDNFGSGSNDCSGTFTSLNDFWPTPISAGAPPFAGAFKPEEPLLATLANAPTDGVWKLRLQDVFTADTGLVGCVRFVILRNP